MVSISKFRDFQITGNYQKNLLGGHNTSCTDRYCTNQNGCPDTEAYMYDESGKLICHSLEVNCCEQES